MANNEIKRAAVLARVKLWQIGEAMGLADCNFSRKLRKELPEDEKEKVLEIIRKLAKEVE